LTLKNHFLQPFYLVVANLSSVDGFKPIGVIDRICPLKFNIMTNGQPLGKYQSATWIPTRGLAVPGDAGIDRVAGRVGETGYLFTGASCYDNLKEVAVAAGSPLDTSKRNLDWGCGCGRISRYFVQESYPEFFGADIDPVNISWMQEHFGDKFVLVSSEPPTSFQECYFDAVFGHSVFTHLKEDAQFSWLKELHRICRVGARIYVTVSAANGLRLTGGQGPGSLASA
jgi:2-polyprenyl-3-methyl-5-hydroxy-6-metoxy-1,4-benzoquinol methylase